MYIHRTDSPLFVSNSALRRKDKTDIAKIERQIDDAKKLEKIHDKMESEAIKIDVQKTSISTRIAFLDTKIRCGRELTDNEMNFLRENSPEIYAKAQRIKRERRQYKNVLNLCRSKYDADNMHLSKLSSLSAEAVKIRNNPDISEEKKEEMLNEITARTMAIQDEYVKFTQTQKYKDLPLMPNGLDGMPDNNVAIKSKSILAELKRRNDEFLKAQDTPKDKLKNRRA